MILACLKPLALLLLPFVAAWLITSYSPIEARWALRLVAFAVAAQVACVAVLPMAMITAVALGDAAEVSWAGGSGATTMTVDGKTAVSTSAGSPIGSIYARPRITQANLHGLDGFRGVDVVGDGDSRILAPFDGTVASVGCDGIAATAFLKRHPVCNTEATWLDMRSADGRFRMVLLHGDYEVQQGQKIRRGQHVGIDNCWGWCSGNHSHIILWDRGVLVSYLDYVGQPSETLPTRDMAGLAAGLAALGYAPNGGSPLRVSHYDPSLGGTNCDSDCSTMASGQKVAAWVGGQNGVYAAACPAEWPFGTRFKLAGKVYQCQDRGGWIKTRHAGEYDPAMGGFTAAETYHWVDLLDTPPVPYGALVHNWKFVD